MGKAGRLLLLVLLGWLSTGTASEVLEFRTEGIRDDVIDLTDLRGQWVVVNFWATWCKPCRKEIPDLDSLHRDRDDVTVIGLAFEEVPPETVLAFLEDHPASYPIALVDVYEPPAVFGTPRVLPTTVLVDPSGRNDHTFLGPVTREAIEQRIDAGGARK